jgi:hypothetical protein
MNLNMLSQLFPRGNVAASTVAEPVRVWRDTVVPPSLDVQRCQVQRHRMSHLDTEKLYHLF